MPDLKSLFLDERPQWFLWIPVLLGLGIGGYFMLKGEPPVWVGLVSMGVFGLAAITFKKHPLILLTTIIMLVISIGFALAQWRTISVDAPVIEKKTRPVYVTGIISDTHIREHGVRMVLSSPIIENIAPENTPEKIRLTVRTNMNNAKIGDSIKVLAILRPPPLPVYPGGYDFARIAYFQHIGAIGYSISAVEVLDTSPQSNFKEKIASLRHNIAESAIATLGKRTGSIAAALLVGERGAIPKKELKNVRHAGLAHLLAISGMHLALVAAVCFFITRMLLACSETLCLRYNIKKWAALAAIAGSFGYLLVSGMPISAQRAFIMTCLVLFAIVMDRTVTPLRLIAWAALAVLIIAPESLLTPSFQMSFAAVTALIAGFQKSRAITSLEDQSYELRRKLKPIYYMVGIILSSFIAGIATTPYGVYHFNLYSSYGILANLIAIPLTSFWVMPWGVLAFVLYPFGAENLAFVPMGWGIDIILNTAEYVASLPHATALLPAMRPLGLFFITMGGCWLLLWQLRWRFWGAPIILIGIFIAFSYQKPDVIIDQEGKLFAVKSNNNDFLFSSKRYARFARNMWLHRLGQTDSPDFYKTDDALKQCDVMGCIYSKNLQKISLTQDSLAVTEDCKMSNFVVNLANAERCKHTPTITRRDLYYKGTHLLWIEEDQPIKALNVQEYRGKRPWSY